MFAAFADDMDHARRLLFAWPVYTIVSACNLPVVELADKRTSCEVECSEPCSARATSHFSFRVNLDPNSPAISWNAAQPDETSAFGHNAMAYANTTQELYFYYIPVCGRVWQYHVLDPMAVERGSGELEFDDDGALKRVTELVPLRLLTGDGELGEPITIDYGPLAPNAGESSSTSIAPGSTIYVLEQDGREAGAGPECR